MKGENKRGRIYTLSQLVHFKFLLPLICIVNRVTDRTASTSVFN